MPGDDQGHAVIDAMTALLILALTITLSLAVLQQARRVAERGSDVQTARNLIDELMAFGPRSFIPSSGAASGFAWRLETQVTGPERPIAVCRRAVDLTHVSSGKQYSAAPFTVCPEEAAE